MTPLSVIASVVVWFADAAGELFGLLPLSEAAEAAAFPPVLLTTAGYYGTLAAVRSLGRAGIAVTVADVDRFAVSKWSRYATRRVRCPDVREPGNRFIEWLLSFGKSSTEKHVLLPTCDDTAWLYGRHHEELSKVFHVGGSTLDALWPLLNKRHLYERCLKLGIDAPRTRFVSSHGEVEQIAREGEFPLLIKPVSQVLWKSRMKGEICADPNWFVERYTVHTKGHLPPLPDFDPTVDWPVVQEFFPAASDCIYNLTGYLDPEAGVEAFRASTKVLQVHRIGVGVCFEHADVRPELVNAVRSLFADVGYAGVFEIEFIQAKDRYLLIDANPRFYGEMAFEIGRGLPLPLLAYHRALGDTDSVRSLARAGLEPGPAAPRVHTHGFGFEVVLNERFLSGAMSGDTVRAWRRWKTDPDRGCTDAVYDANDPLPAVSDAAGFLYWRARYPVDFFRDVVKHRFKGLVKTEESEAQSVLSEAKQIPLPPRDFRNRAS